MSWQDDLQSRIDQASQNIGNDIKSYINARVIEPVTKIGEPAQGNLSALELSQGARGSNSTQTVPISYGSSNEMNKWALPLIAIAVLGYFLISKKRG